TGRYSPLVRHGRESAFRRYPDVQQPGRLGCAVHRRAHCRPVPPVGGLRMPIKAILTDIEGTTSAVSFVFDVLFPYAREHLPQYVRSHADEPAVAAQIEAVRSESGEA